MRLGLGDGGDAATQMGTEPLRGAVTWLGSHSMLVVGRDRSPGLLPPGPGHSGQKRNSHSLPRPVHAHPKRT